MQDTAEDVAGSKQTKRGQAWSDQSMRAIDLDVGGLGKRLCDLLSLRPGDMVEFHMLSDGSVRVINPRNIR